MDRQAFFCKGSDNKYLWLGRPTGKTDDIALALKQHLLPGWPIQGGERLCTQVPSMGDIFEMKTVA